MRTVCCACAAVLAALVMAPPASAEKVPMERTTHAHTKMPMTMEGMPFITSVTKRMPFGRRPPSDSAR